MKVIDIEDLPKRGSRAPKHLKSVEDGIRVLVTGKAVLLDVSPSQAKAGLKYLQDKGNADATGLSVIGRAGKAYLVEG